MFTHRLWHFYLIAPQNVHPVPPNRAVSHVFFFLDKLRLLRHIPNGCECKICPSCWKIICSNCSKDLHFLMVISTLYICRQNSLEYNEVAAAFLCQIWIMLLISNNYRYHYSHSPANRLCSQKRSYAESFLTF